MRKLRYNVAMSLDGYIAGPNGEYDWIPSDPVLDSGYMVELFGQFDLFVMGRKTFETIQAQGDQNPLRNEKVVVFSTTLQDTDDEMLTITSKCPEEVIPPLKSLPGKDLWLFGGGVLFRSLLDAGLADTVEVALVPVLLGSGIKLVPDGQMHKLTFESAQSFPSGIQMLIYRAS